MEWRLPFPSLGTTADTIHSVSRERSGASVSWFVQLLPLGSGGCVVSRDWICHSWSPLRTSSLLVSLQSFVIVVSRAIVCRRPVNKPRIASAQVEYLLPLDIYKQ